MDKPIKTDAAAAKASSLHPETYTRFSLLQRIEHIVFLVSFSLLGITGLAQKYASAPLGLATLQAFGGIESTRVVHHYAAIVMLIVSGVHIISAAYRILVLRVPWTMMPLIDDFKHLMHDLGYYFGLRKEKAYYGRYNYAEKAEYLAVVWGTVVMALTGFMMWNPITTTQYLPGEAIPAAKAAHGAEAVLAVLAIIIWHMYHVHVKLFNKSMFTGVITRHEMEEEHPAELAEVEAGKSWQRPPETVIRQRQRWFFPSAAVLSVVMVFGLYYALRVEPSTAILTVPRGETVAVFAPLTPTPRPTPAPTPTPVLAAGVSTNGWEGKYSPLFRNRCGTCHVRTAVGGLSLAAYQDALKGGASGPGIVPGNPDASQIVTVQAAGGHPGQLTIDELNALVEWIRAGAPEN